MQQSSSAWTRWAPPVTRNLIVINFIIYFASVLLLRRGFDLAEVAGLHYFESSAFRVWQLLTYQFLHSTSSIEHVLSNMFALYMFGSSIEYFWGSKRYLIYYLLCGISAGLVQELSWYYELREVVQYASVQLPIGDRATRHLPQYAEYRGGIGSCLRHPPCLWRTLPQLIRPHWLRHTAEDEVFRLPLRRLRTLRWHPQHLGSGSPLRSPRWDDRRSYPHLSMA